jgi:hypothetical protein
LVAAFASVSPAYGGGGVGFSLTANLEGEGHPFVVGSKHRVQITVADGGEASLRQISVRVREFASGDPAGGSADPKGSGPPQTPAVVCDAGVSGTMSLERFGRRGYVGQVLSTTGTVALALELTLVLHLASPSPAPRPR